MLVAAALLLGTPAAVRLLLLVAVAAHAVVRQPRAAPLTIVVAADGSCELLEQGGERLTLGPRTLVCPLWVRLDLGTAPRRRELVLFADQLSAADWARLRARLQRARGR